MNQKTSRPAEARRAPASTHLVEVRLRPDFADAEGASALALLHGLGLNVVRDIRTARIYQLRGQLNAGQAQQAARELLSDPVTQEFRLLSPQAPVLNGMTHWRVEVWLKGSVSDPVGDTVRKALVGMGLPTLDSVRVGTAYLLNGKCGRNQLEKAIPRSLANPVVHRFTVSEAHP